MKSSKIKVGHAYYVDFEPTRKAEFGGKHLAIVIKKNHDAISFVVIPTTSKDSGLEINKISLGKLACLPSNIKNDTTYAVIDQIRTVDASRFYELKDNGQTIDAEIPVKIMNKIYKAIIRDLLHDVPDEEIKNILL